MNFLFRAKNGKPTFESDYAKLRFQDHLSKNEGKLYRIEQVQNTRSLQQNSLLWLYYTTIADHTGYTPDEVHQVMKQRHLPKQKVVLRGGEYEVIKSTTKLRKGEMVEFLMNIERDASDMGIILPNPQEWKKNPDNVLG